MARGLKFWIKKVKGLDCVCSENKALISFAVTAKLICVFVFAYAKRWFSHEAAHLVMCISHMHPTLIKAIVYVTGVIQMLC